MTPIARLLLQMTVKYIQYTSYAAAGRLLLRSRSDHRAVQAVEEELMRNEVDPIPSQESQHSSVPCPVPRTVLKDTTRKRAHG